MSRVTRGLGPLLAALLVLGAIQAATANAAPASPHWSIASEAQPSYFHAGDTADAYVLIVRNDGAAPTTRDSAVTITDELPTGVTATKLTATGTVANGSGLPRYEFACSGVPATGVVSCKYEETATHGRVLAGATIVMTVTVAISANIKEDLGPEEELGPKPATVSGGGAPSASISETTPIDAAPVPFGLSFFDLDATEESGQADTQAGSHPFELTASLAFNVSGREAPSSHNGGREAALANAAPKDLQVELPPGLIGDPNAVPRCSQQAFLEGEKLSCPVDTQVGTAEPSFYGSFPSAVFPVYDIVPPPGEPGELGFSVARVGRIPIFFQVRPDGNYGLTANIDDIPETGPLQGVILALWGLPASHSHDLEREGTLGEAEPGQEHDECKPQVNVEGGVEEQAGCPSGIAPRPFLTLPSECGGESTVPALGDSWQRPEAPLLATLHKDRFAAITGCEQLSFNPSLALAPETTQAAAPSGYTIELHVPQNEDPTQLATPDLRNAVVSLPPGVVISPSVANGLQVCSREQFGLHSLAGASCPSRSQIGTAKITTPLVPSPLEGQVFLGEPECAPCSPTDAQEGRLIRLLLQAQGAGVTVKLEGSVSIDQGTGQLTATFNNAPQLPFEALKLTLDGGANAALVNPSICGTPLSASSWLTPYSSEVPAEPFSQAFEVTGCQPPQFHPSFVAGTTHNQAGAFSPLTVTLTRSDREEDLENVSVQLPPGLLGFLAKIPLCAEAQARAGACAPQSEVGTATVGAGPGANPVFLNGHVYLTGPYEGAPFGLSIVVPAVAGPFNLGTIVVGARIEVNPSTAALTILSDPLPQSLDGIPLQLGTVNLDIDRAGFIFNPTNCQPLGIQATLESSDDAVASVSSSFQAANCATLAFKPKLTALTHATASKAGGVHLHVRITSTPGQANLAAVKLDLPRSMVSRLSTLQKACTAAVFAARPASCPAASAVGTATVLTPVLRQPLSGPVYVVSHGNTATPELALVLQAEGVTLELVGQTGVKGGIVSGTFRSLPDAPISELDLLLDAGPHSLLAANLPAKAHGGMCGRSLAMPVALTAQNGAVRKQSVKVAVSGCPEHRASKRQLSKRKA
ncbi:MAG: hypothetical protein ACLP1Q_02010 [Solirubrobacteraceae bacterium]